MTSARHVRWARFPEQLPAAAPKCALRLLRRRPFRWRKRQASRIRLALEPGRKGWRRFGAERDALADLLDRLGELPIAAGILAHAWTEEVLEDLHVAVVAEAVRDVG